MMNKPFPLKFYFVINTFINVFHVINYKLEAKFITILKYLLNINLLNTLGLVK